MANPSSPVVAAPTRIAVFDSGFGGLTVLRAMLPFFPGAHFHYLGDTARLPYGEKSQQTIARYALSAAAFLLAQGADMLVVACNTASALALDDLEAALPIPVIGVIEPGTQAAALALAPSSWTDPNASDLTSETWVPPTPQASRQPQVLVLATSATVQSAAYSRALARLGIASYEKACPLLVPLVEEGWIDHPVTSAVLRIYLAEALAEAPAVTTLVLGCTHYPLLKPFIEQTLTDLNRPLRIVDSAHATAETAAAILAPQPLLNPTTCTFYATDSIAKFQRLGSAFLGQPVPHVQLVDLGG